jgi:hypothetical protein
MDQCNCKSPPCKCKSSERETVCSHKTRGEYFEEQRELGLFKGYHQIVCGKEGTLREDCNYFFEHKLVLCEEHYDYHFQRADRRCGMCNSAMRDCTC